MNTITALIFEENLIRHMDRDGEPWFVGRDVCHVLGLKNESQKLADLDEDERAEVSIAYPSGAKMVIIVSEAGVFRLIFTSRKPEAERFKRWLAHDVLPQIRKTGSFSIHGARWDGTGGDTAAYLTLPLREREHCLETVTACARLFGQERAREMWRSLGIPLPPEAQGNCGLGGARECLWLVMGASHNGARLADVVNAALNDDEAARITAREAGIYVEAEEDGFIIANVSPFLSGVFAGSPWARGGWRHALRRLPGAIVAPRRTYTNGLIARGTFLRSQSLDLFAENT